MAGSKAAPKVASNPLARLLGRVRGAGLRLPDTSKCKPWPTRGVLVGGAVRDLLLGKEPSDLDWLVTDPAAEAERCAALTGGSLFCMDEARGHWRVVVRQDAHQTHDYAPLTFLGETSLGGEAGITEAEWLKAAVERDLWRRDLTVNALALTETGALIDPTGGAHDLRQRVLRAPRESNLQDDTLRPLRVVRFAATLGFTLADQTRATVRSVAAQQAAGTAQLPAMERVGAELTALLLSSGAADGVRLLEDLGLLAVYLPELADGRGALQRGLHHLDVLDHNIEALSQLVSGFPDSGPALRWATLLHDVGKPATRGADDFGRVTFHGHAHEGARLTGKILERLRLPGEVVTKAVGLVRYHMVQLPQDERAARRFVHRRRALLPDLLRLMLADREAARGRRASGAGRTAYRLAVARVLAILDEAPPAAPLLRGEDVMELLALPPGPRVGEALAFVAEAVAVGDVADVEGAQQLLLGYAAAQGWNVKPT